MNSVPASTAVIRPAIFGRSWWPVLAIAVAAVGCSSETDSTTITTTAREESTMRLTSSAFGDGGSIPVRYTCDGADVSPPLEISGIPEGTVSLVLVMDDPDAPAGTWDHWVAFDISPVDTIPEGTAGLGRPGRNSWGRTGYGGPCPPSGTHRYMFTVHALAGTIGLGEGATKGEVLAALEPLRLASASLMGTYRR